MVERVRRLEPDHILITGDLTTTALPAEFRAAREPLEPLAGRSRHGSTILPGNHDRYTIGAHRARRFEQFFGEFARAATIPGCGTLDRETAILGLDPTRASLTASGTLPGRQLERARELLAGSSRDGIARLIVACHYPLDAPPPYRRELAGKRMINAEALRSWLATIGPHLYCCGHVHAAWAFRARRDSRTSSA